MKRLISFVAAAAVLAPAAVAFAADRPIAVSDDSFEPGRAKASLGDTVSWRWGPPDSFNPHNVRQDDKLFYSGGTTGSGQLSITPSAGTYGYYCELHGFQGGGMAGVVRVKPVLVDRKGRRATIAWASPQTDTGSKFDLRWRKGKGKFRMLEKGTRETQRTVKLRRGNKHELQARSKQGRKRSGWSPKLKLKG